MPCKRLQDDQAAISRHNERVPATAEHKRPQLIGGRLCPRENALPPRLCNDPDSKDEKQHTKNASDAAADAAAEVHPTNWPPRRGTFFSRSILRLLRLF